MDGKAVISMHRVTGGQDLYEQTYHTGSYIEIAISEAHEYESVGEKKIMDGKRLMRVALSPVQFSELITNIGVSSGVPCTLNYYDGESITYKKTSDVIEDVSARIKEKYISSMPEAINKDKIEKLLDGVRMKKDVREKLLELISPNYEQGRSDREFFLERLDEVVNEKASKAMLDLDAHAHLMVFKEGLKSIATKKVEDRSQKFFIDMPGSGRGV